MLEERPYAVARVRSLRSQEGSVLALPLGSQPRASLTPDDLIAFPAAAAEPDRRAKANKHRPQQPQKAPHTRARGRGAGGHGRHGLRPEQGDAMRPEPEPAQAVTEPEQPLGDSPGPSS